MTLHSSAALKLPEVQSIIRRAVKNENIFCVGIDGPTASGKTIFAKLLQEEIAKNAPTLKVQIVQLDYLLVDRKLRERSLNNIRSAGIGFEHEAELHMDFSRLQQLIEKIDAVRSSKFNSAQVSLSGLYDRENNGRCTKSLSFEIDKSSILIFEGHYTIRPELAPYLNDNLILLGDKPELVKRKMERSQGYRDTDTVAQYFDLIDEPSYLSNFLRFADASSLIIDNSTVDHPKVVSYRDVFKLLGASDYLNDRGAKISQADDFVFGRHGLSVQSDPLCSKLFAVLDEVDISDAASARKSILQAIPEDFHPVEVHSVRPVDEKSNEIWFTCNMHGKLCKLALRGHQASKQLFLSWEGGAFLLSDGRLARLIDDPRACLSLSLGDIENPDLYCEMSSVLFSNIAQLNSEGSAQYLHGFFEDLDEIAFVTSAFRHTSLRCFSFGEFSICCQRAIESSLPEQFKRGLAFELHGSAFDRQSPSFERHLTEAFSLSPDFLTLNSMLTRETMLRLKSIFFESDNLKLRSTIFKCLTHVRNQSKVPAGFVELLNNLQAIFPTSMSKLYTFSELSAVTNNVLAVNAYDLSADSIDISAYLTAAAESGRPTIVQISQNAVGQLERNGTTNSVGYLKPQNGIGDFAQAVQRELLLLLEESGGKNLTGLFFGLGLDHVDVRGDDPNGRSTRFVDQAIAEECITHITLDGSECFKPANSDKTLIADAYVEVFQRAFEFYRNCDACFEDLEFCTGELNYVGDSKEPHFPSGLEISELETHFSKALAASSLGPHQKYKISNQVKLYVGNLGTTHHGDDVTSQLNLSLGHDWKDALVHSTFISPVLHGTTGSKDMVFEEASKFCKKINIAGSFLKIMLESLQKEDQQLLGYKEFDATSKTLCANIRVIDKSRTKFAKSALKNAFNRHGEICSVLPLSERTKLLCRKPLYGRTPVADKIFDCLAESLNT